MYGYSLASNLTCESAFSYKNVAVAVSLHVWWAETC